MADIQKYLDEVKGQCDELVDQIAKFRSSREVHLASAEVMNSMAAALKETANQIEPLTERGQKKTQVMLKWILLTSFSSLAISGYLLYREFFNTQ